MSGEFDYTEDDQGHELPVCPAAADLFTTGSVESAVEGLQACIQISILVPCGDENTFRSDS